MLEILKTYYPVLFLLFFIFMLYRTGLKILELGSKQKNTDTTQIDKHLNMSFSEISEIEVVNALKNVKFEYKGW